MSLQDCQFHDIATESHCQDVRAKVGVLQNIIFFSDESASGDEVEAFFAGLGGGSPDDVADEAASGDDAAFERSEAVSFKKFAFLQIYVIKGSIGNK